MIEDLAIALLAFPLGFVVGVRWLDRRIRSRYVLIRREPPWRPPRAL